MWANDPRFHELGNERDPDHRHAGRLVRHDHPEAADQEEDHRAAGVHDGYRWRLFLSPRDPRPSLSRRQCRREAVRFNSKTSQKARSAGAMRLTDLLISGANVSVVVFVVSSTLAVGLGLTLPQILAPLRNVRLVVLSLVANFVLSPLVAIGLARVLGLDEPLAVGLLLCGVAAGAPFLIKLADLAKGNMPFAVGIMVVLMVITVGYMPIVLPLLVEGVSVDPASIARSLIVLMLIPLAVGLALRAWHPPSAARVRAVVAPVSSISMVFVVTLTTAATFPECSEHSGYIRHRGGRHLYGHLFRDRLGSRRSRRGHARRALSGHRPAEYRCGTGRRRPELQRCESGRHDHGRHDCRVRHADAALSRLGQAAATR